MKRAFFALAAAFAFAGCDKNSNTDSPVTPPEQSDFTIEQKALTQGSFDVRITPKDNESTYYFNVITKKDYESRYESDNVKLVATYKAWFEQLADQQGIELKELLENALLSGMQNYQFRTLVPETDYVFFVYGLDYEGNKTTDVATVEFKTPKAVLNSDATFNIEATEVAATWFKVKISCSDPNVFFYYDVMDPSVYQQYCGGDPANIPAYMTEYLTALKSESDTYSAMTEAEFITGITVDGEVEYDTALSEAANSLLPEMEYPVFAIGIANDGSYTTNATVVMVKTAETPRNDWLISDETVTDIQYNATITPAWDEAYAVILERQTYFEGMTDDQMVDALLAARKGTFTEELCAERVKVQFSDLIPSEDYYLFMIACTPDGQPKTGSKLNVKKQEVKMKDATMTGAEYSVNVFNVTKTSAQVSVSVNTAGEGQTFLTNYISKAELDSRTATMTESEALKKHMDELIDANLKAWNASHSEMDRKEFLSRVLPGESKTGTGNYITIDGLSAGTDYYAYVIGIKADGTYTTEPFKSAFSTISDKKSKVTISTAMTGTTYEEVFPGKVTYTIFTYANPTDSAGKVYGKIFQGTDEWAGKSADEILAELAKDENKGDDASYWRSFVNWTDPGVKFYVYSVGYDTDGMPTDILKCSHTGKASECGTNYNFKNVTFDKTETLTITR